MQWADQRTPIGINNCKTEINYESILAEYQLKFSIYIAEAISHDLFLELFFIGGHLSQKLSHLIK